MILFFGGLLTGIALGLIVAALARMSSEENDEISRGHPL